MKKPVLGLCLTETQAQAVIVEQNTSSNTLLATAEWSNTLFDYAGDDTPGVDDFVDHLSQFVSHHRLAVKPDVSVALDSSLMFINTIPLASTVSRSEIDEQIQWELQTHFPGSPKNTFITDFHILTTPSDNDWDNVLMVSVRRDLVRKLHHSLGRIKYRLETVDVDQFAAETALRYNHADTAAKHIALVGVKPRRLDVSLVRYHDLETYRYFVTHSEQETVGQLMRTVSDSKAISGMILYGDVGNELLSQAQREVGIPVSLLNPVRSVSIVDSVRADTSFTSNMHGYAAAIGAALRRD